MDLFKTFRETLKGKLRRAKKEPAWPELLAALDTAQDWDVLEERLVGLRAVSRKRQQETLDRLEPLAKRVEEMVAQARETRIKVIKNNLLRQADGYMAELEAEDEPAKIHGANCAMLTNILKQVRRGKAMAERSIDAEAVDTITSHLEEIVVAHESTLEAMAELEQAGDIRQDEALRPEALEQRLAAIYEDGDTDEETMQAASATREKELVRKLYE